MELTEALRSEPEGERRGPAVRMPALAAGTAAHAHSIDSALVVLEAMGVGAHRIRLRRIGRDARPAGSIVRQRPAPGEEVAAATLVELDIAGLGFTQALPVGMWDSGGEAAAGTREILDALDDPLEKLKHWFHEGAPLFRLSSDDLPACARWLALFGIAAEEWPETMWYGLASLVADLPEMVCSEEGCALVLGVLLQLPVRGFRYRPLWAPVPQGAVSFLADRNTQLGVDLLVGNLAEDLAATVVEVGPVPLAVYERLVETDEGADLLRRVLALVMPLPATYTVDWLVGDTARPPELGRPARNARLGVNSHMGAARPVVPEAVPGESRSVWDGGQDWRRQGERGGVS